MGRPRKNYSREDIIERDQAKCWICGVLIDLELKHPHPRSLTLDHIVPISRGGSNTMNNVACAHKICNEAKTNYLPCEFITGIEGLMFRRDGKSAVLIMLDSDDELFYILNKLSRSRFKKLKESVKLIRSQLNNA